MKYTKAVGQILIAAVLVVSATIIFFYPLDAIFSRLFPDNGLGALALAYYCAGLIGVAAAGFFLRFTGMSRRHVRLVIGLTLGIALVLVTAPELFSGPVIVSILIAAALFYAAQNNRPISLRGSGKRVRPRSKR